MKTCEEWSLAFDLEYQNITSNQAPGLNEFEKSRFLTWAEQTVVVGLYNGAFGKAFEETEELSAYLASLVHQEEGIKVVDQTTVPHIVDGSEVYVLPADLLFRTFEKCVIDNGVCGDRDAVVIPVTQDAYWRTARNPFKGANANRVLRLTTGDFAESEGSSPGFDTLEFSELVSTKPIKKYIVRYVRKPEPIILETLTDGLEIEGETEAKPCKLHEKLHQTILAEAVRMAKAVWSHPNN